MAWELVPITAAVKLVIEAPISSTLVHGPDIFQKYHIEIHETASWVEWLFNFPKGFSIPDKL